MTERAPARLRSRLPRIDAVASYLLCAAALMLLLTIPRPVEAFGEAGAFHPRVLLTGKAVWEGVRTSAPAEWSAELTNRTSAPARILPTTVRADDPELLSEPFAIWGGAEEVAPLTRSERAGLLRFLAMGGVLFVDDFDPDRGVFSQSAEGELKKIWPDAKPVGIGKENVVFRSFYLMQRPFGRVEGPEQLTAIVRGGLPQVLFSKHDLLGALARGASGVAPLSVSPGGEAQRQQAIRLAVNIAMFVLCSNYKDDQVHAEHLMRRRGSP